MRVDKGAAPWYHAHMSTTHNNPAETSRACSNCGLNTDEVGPLCPIEGRWHGMCGECYADIRADEDFAERGGYD